MVKVILFSLIFIVTLVTNGCYLKPVSEADLIGKYRVELPEGTITPLAVESLELLPNGECLQEIHLIGGATYTARGKWRYTKDINCLYLEGTRMALKNTAEINPNLTVIPSGNTGALSVTRSLFGNVKIGLGEDIYYKKQH